jgi:hypothetical protein
MKGFLFLGAGAFLAGAAVAVAMDRRSGLDEDFGEDRNWPAVPYTAATHPDSPQERMTGSAAAEPPSAPAEPSSARNEQANGASATAPENAEEQASSEPS